METSVSMKNISDDYFYLSPNEGDPEKGANLQFLAWRIP